MSSLWATAATSESVLPVWRAQMLSRSTSANWATTTSCWKRGEVVSEPSARRWGHVTKTAFAGALPIGEDPELNQLTAREREVMRLIALGHTYKEAAQRLDISVKTMERHVSAVLRKLQLSNRHQLARWAADRGIV